MRKLALTMAATLSVTLSALGASAQSTTGYVAQPFVAGNPGLFTTAILNINLTTFFSGLGKPTGNDFRSNSFFAPQYSGLSSNNPFVLDHRLSDFGRGSSTNTTVGTSQLYIVMTGLENSSNPAAASTGIVVPNTISGNGTGTNPTISNISFQYSPLSGTTGLVTNNLGQAPYLAITDEGGARSRLLPITAGYVASNAAINQYNNAFNNGTSSSTTATYLLNETGNNPEGFISVSFTAAQLGIVGTVTQVGLVYTTTGITLINAFSVNGATTGFNPNSISGYPF